MEQVTTPVPYHFSLKLSIVDLESEQLFPVYCRAAKVFRIDSTITGTNI